MGVTIYRDDLTNYHFNFLRVVHPAVNLSSYRDAAGARTACANTAPMCATELTSPKIWTTLRVTLDWLSDGCFLGNTIGETIVSDVLGEPESWANCISNELVGLPDLRAATILDVFVSRNELTLYALAANGAEAMAVFAIENTGLRNKIATVMQPGLDISTVLQAAI